MGAEDCTRTVDYVEFSALKADITDMKSLMGRMVETMSRIAVIEERQHAMAMTANKALERMEALANRQHEIEVENAGNASIGGRVGQLELAFRDIHLESVSNKASFNTVVWMVRSLWAVVGTSGALWLIQAVARPAIGA